MDALFRIQCREVVQQLPFILEVTPFEALGFRKIALWTSAEPAGKRPVQLAFAFSRRAT